MNLLVEANKPEVKRTIVVYAGRFQPFHRGHGEVYKWLKDKFGVSWQGTSPEMMKYLGGSDPDGAKRATDAMLKMKKIDLATMKLAYEGTN